jgi:hypothetical protein
VRKSAAPGTHVERRAAWPANGKIGQRGAARGDAHDHFELASGRERIHVVAGQQQVPVWQQPYATAGRAAFELHQPRTDPAFELHRPQRIAGGRKLHRNPEHEHPDQRIERPRFPREVEEIRHLAAGAGRQLNRPECTDKPLLVVFCPAEHVAYPPEFFGAVVSKQ